MRCDYLIRAIGCIDGALVDEAENYKPTRKNHAWIWAAASAACLLMIVGVFALRSAGQFLIRNTETAAYAVVHSGGKAERYIDYAAVAEKGAVTITDELKALLDENKEPTVKLENGHKATVIFNVCVYDAGGVYAKDLFKTCLEPLGLRYEDHESFAENGIISLTREQIYAVKGSPWLSLIIAPQLVEINEKYLDTVSTDTLKVRVYMNTGVWDVLEQIDVGDKAEAAEKHISAFFDEYARDYGINGVSADHFGVYANSFIGEFDVELIKQMLTDPRTERVCIDNSDKYK